MALVQSPSWLLLAFCPEILGGSNSILSFYERRLSGGGTQTVPAAFTFVHFNPLCCNRICLEFLQS